MTIEKRLPKFLTTKEFKEHIINWSDATIRRRIHESDPLPAIKQGRSYIFETQEVLDWLKRNTVRAG